MSAQSWVAGTAIAAVVPLAPTQTPPASINYRVVGRDRHSTEDSESTSRLTKILSATLDEKAAAPDYSHIREVLERVRDRERARSDVWEDTTARPVLPRWKKSRRRLPRADFAPMITAPVEFDYFEQY